MSHPGPDADHRGNSSSGWVHMDKGPHTRAAQTTLQVVQLFKMNKMSHWGPGKATFQITTTLFFNPLSLKIIETTS